MRILVVGATGMVGRSVLRKLDADSSLSVVGTTTGKEVTANLTRFQWPQDSLNELVDEISPDVILNLAAKLDNKSVNNDQVARQKMFALNSDLLLNLSAASEKATLIHMSTDGVFSGKNPPYTEKSDTDGEGIYAKSKIQGELNITNGKILRCSILGRSPDPQISIPNLLLRQQRNAVMAISNNELWNGITSNAFAEFLHSLLVNNFLDMMLRVQHIIPRYPLTKKELFQEVSKAVGREDINFDSTITEDPRSRILATQQMEFLKSVWEQTSFGKIPSIEEMLEKSEFLNV
jgi:dTDP-4-dehydrorhamnose reductase